MQPLSSSIPSGHPAWLFTGTVFLQGEEISCEPDESVFHGLLTPAAAAS